MLLLHITHRYSVKDNLMLDSKEDCISELKLYKKAGGKTLCDITPISLRYITLTMFARMIPCYRVNPDLLPEISRESGVTIIVGTAYYVDTFLTSEVRSMSIEQVAIHHDFSEGFVVKFCPLRELTEW